MFIKNLIWWLVFILCSVWAQHFISGSDILVVGLIISMQEDRPMQTVWLFCAFVLIQEGAGSLAFGASLFRYSAAVVLFRMGRWLFEPRNVIFMFFLGLALGVLNYFLLDLMATLQNIEIGLDRLSMESLVQVEVFLPAWGLAQWIRGKRESDAIVA